MKKKKYLPNGHIIVCTERNNLMNPSLIHVTCKENNRQNVNHLTPDKYDQKVVADVLVQLSIYLKPRNTFDNSPPLLA